MCIVFAFMELSGVQTCFGVKRRVALRLPIYYADALRSSPFLTLAFALFAVTENPRNATPKCSRLGYIACSDRRVTEDDGGIGVDSCFEGE